MQRLGHTHIDLLKLDIEGAEYAVIANIIASGLKPRQFSSNFTTASPAVEASFKRSNQSGSCISTVTSCSRSRSPSRNFRLSLPVIEYPVNGMTTRLLTLSNSDTGGGAAHAAIRLHQTFRQIGIPATMLVRHKHSDDASIQTVRDVGGTIGQARSLTSYLLDRRPLSFYPHRQKDRYFSLNWFPTGIAGQVRAPTRRGSSALEWSGVRASWRAAPLPATGVWTLHD